MNDLKGIIEDCNKSDLVSYKIIKKIIEIIGQEEWQDLHDENNDICTTMGELIITLKGIPNLEKENAKLEEKISVLLSCKKCPDNKGGFICQKEYEDKCLAQKIQFIKELQQENAELKEYNKYLRRKRQGGIQKQYNKVAIIKQQKEQLTNAKEIIRDFLSVAIDYIDKEDKNYCYIAEAEQFLK